MEISRLFKTNLLPVWLVVLSFGPYVLPSLGLRTEHVLVYALFVLGILILMVKRRPVFYDSELILVFSLMFALTILTSYSTAFCFDDIMSRASLGKIISHAEKYIRPMAVIVGLCAFFRIEEEYSPRRSLIDVSKALVYMLALNSTLIMAQLFVDLSPILSRFTYGMGSASFDGELRSVSDLGLTMGRFTGIFNQPAEAGLAYGLGLFAWAYLNSFGNKVSFLSRKDYLLLGLVAVGGFFSISKIFLIIGVPMFLFYLLIISRKTHILNLKFLAIVMIGITVIGYFLRSRETFYSLYTLMEAFDNRSISALTGGRLGQQSSVGEQFQYIWGRDPLYGLGFASYTCLDNGYLEFFAQGGLACLVVYIALLVCMFLAALKHIKTEEGRFLMFIVVFISAAAVGMPPLTANRFSPIIWVFIVLIYFVFYSNKRSSNARKAMA